MCCVCVGSAPGDAHIFEKYLAWGRFLFPSFKGGTSVGASVPPKGFNSSEHMVFKV